MAIKTPLFNYAIINTKQINRKCYFTQHVGSLLKFKNSKKKVSELNKDDFRNGFFVAAEVIKSQIMASGQFSTHHPFVTVFIHSTPFFFLLKRREIKCLKVLKRITNWIDHLLFLALKFYGPYLPSDRASYSKAPCESYSWWNLVKFFQIRRTTLIYIKWGLVCCCYVTFVANANSFWCIRILREKWELLLSESHCVKLQFLDFSAGWSWRGHDILFMLWHNTRKITLLQP